MGRGNRVCHAATLGCEPQDLSYTPDKARPLHIGDHNHFKEYVNISGGVKEEHGTVIGNHNYLMNHVHVGHDCVLGDHNIIAGNTVLSGHVELDHHAFLSGQVAVHQFCRIGAYVMVGGVSGVNQDVPPYCMVNGQRARYLGLNLVGLRRNGFSAAQRNVIKQAYQTLFRSGLRQSQALQRIHDELNTPEVRAIIEFAQKSRRGMVSSE
jgi:UDP-N-acetylglucosamine acyltransferase